MFAATAALFAQSLGDQLHDAARSGDSERAKALLSKGADVNAKGLYDQTPLFFAADRGHVEVVKVLLAAGAKVNIKDTFYGMTPAARASMKKRYDVISLLLAAGAEGAGELLAQAASSDDTGLAKAAIASGKLTPADLSAALAIAEKEKKANVVEVLKAAGAKPPPPANYAADPAVLATYVGKYAGGRGGNEFDVDVAVDAGKLTAKFGNSTMTFGAVSNTEFRNDERQLTIVFQTESGGAVTGFALKPWNQVYARKK